VRSFLLRLVSAAALPVLSIAAQPSAPGRAPSLVVVIAVDQMRADYLERFASQFTGGLARLLRDGAVFTNAVHDHAITETAPGHATLLSGRFPRSTGITANVFGVEDDSMPLVTGEGAGASPRRFRGTTLADWMAKGDADTRVLSVSMKDRGAILPVARQRWPVLWYSPDGQFTTSRYYGDSLPQWVLAINQAPPAWSFAGKPWTLLLPESAYSEPDSVPEESSGSDFVFPHAIPNDDLMAAGYVRTTPYIDSLTLDVAWRGVRANGLGARNGTDLLAVSLSATDYVGHRFGPDSREIHDQIVRLDRQLGWFLDSLVALRGADRVVVALSADHGVQRIPALAARGWTRATLPPARVTLAKEWQSVLAWYARQKGDTTAVFFENGVLLANRQRAARAKVSIETLTDTFVARMRAAPRVLRAESFTAMAAADTVRDEIARRWLHMFDPGGIALAAVTLEPGNIWGERLVATHGTPHHDDAHVPLLFWGAGVRAGRYTDRVRVVDLAPTLAALIGVTPTERVDGIVLEQTRRR
jgi:predicted AlkP superfamily pyrophosphatase or phosphodiesterase